MASLNQVTQTVAERFKVGWKRVTGIRLRSSTETTSANKKPKVATAPVNIQMTDWQPSKLSRQSGSLGSGETDLSNSAGSDLSDTTQADRLEGSFTEASSVTHHTG
ncbi:hypothetical protein WJX72_005229 [[Myrmecia] bisecta]|uniref:Uncharacterized protein n=1 Tax=[Myrmecia] bisecta TaxID=41462 RepID=A0AAW1PPD5_9CHLO